MKVLRLSPDSEMVLMVQRNSVRVNLFLTYDFIANQLLGQRWKNESLETFQIILNWSFTSPLKKRPTLKFEAPM